MLEGVNREGIVPIECKNRESELRDYSMEYSHPNTRRICSGRNRWYMQATERPRTSHGTQTSAYRVSYFQLRRFPSAIQPTAVPSLRCRVAGVLASVIHSM